MKEESLLVGSEQQGCSWYRSFAPLFKLILTPQLPSPSVFMEWGKVWFTPSSQQLFQVHGNGMWQSSFLSPPLPLLSHVASPQCSLLYKGH